MPVMVIDPKLTAGWEPETLVTDSLLRRFNANWTLALEAHGIPLGGRTLRRDDLAAVDLERPAEIANVATLLAPLFSEGVDEVMAALDDFYRFTAGKTPARAISSVLGQHPISDLTVGRSSATCLSCSGRLGARCHHLRRICGSRKFETRKNCAPSRPRPFAAFR